MKRFLVITSNSAKTIGWKEREVYVREFCAALEAAVPDSHAVYATYDDITFSIRGGEVLAYDNRNATDIKDYDMVHFKNWASDTIYAGAIADYLDFHGVTFYNTEVDSGLAGSKITQMSRLALEGLPVPDTYFAKKAALAKVFKSGNLPDGFKYPLIMKGDFAARGLDNYLIDDAKKALEVLKDADEDKEFVLQEFLPNEGDYRLLFIGTTTDPLVFIRKGLPGSHLNNTYQGGQGSFVSIKDLPEDYIELGREAAISLKREICGVDLIVNKDTNKVYILEVNGTPAIATGFGVKEKTAKFAEFLNKELNTQKDKSKLRKEFIGRADHITFNDGDIFNLPAKIDTGAYSSSVWATNIEEKDNYLFFTLLGPESPFYSGKQLKTKEYKVVHVENSFGDTEDRYSVFLTVTFAERKIRTNFTLANRGSKTYAALIGRKMLKNRFVVDVSVGKPLINETANGDESLE